MAECPFCAIAAGRAPAHRVLEDGRCVAFLDVRPLFPGHTLVVPKAHRAVLVEVPHAELGALVAAAQDIARAMGPALGSDGTFLALNDRVSQSVAHVHMHVVPRRNKDGLRGFFWPRVKYASEAEADGVASRLRDALAIRREP